MDAKLSAILADVNTMAPPAECEYQCPGESYTISRAIHLARLADSFPACADCPHRTDTGTLSKVRVKRLNTAWRHRGEREFVCSEAIAGRYGEELDAKSAWSWGAAFGVRLAQELPGTAIRVAVGSDGRGLSAELVQAVAEGVRWTGAACVDCGETTAPGIAWMQRALETEGALLIGNPLGLAQSAGIRFWGPVARPWSSPGELDTLLELTSSGIDRPGRTSGLSSRQPMHALYLDTFREAYHALRPVKLVLDTACRRLTLDLNQLLENVACRMLPLRRVGEIGKRPTAPLTGEHAIARQVRGEAADFGIWIDGDGEACRVWDELGEPVSGEVLLFVLLQAVDDNAPRNIVLESDSFPAIAKTIKSRGFIVKAGDTTRQSMHDQIAKFTPAWGGGPSGRLWLASHSPAPDSLLTLTRLLQLLSRSDRPLSQVVAESLADRQPTG